MLRRTIAELDEQAKRMAREVNARASEPCARVVDGYSQMGSGSLPTQNLPTRLVSITSPITSPLSPGELAAQLRQLAPPVFVRIHKGQVLLDPRTLLDGDEPIVVESLVAILAAQEGV
jgi:L-seryl-tRNA(Ser) seleniumtransferase